MTQADFLREQFAVKIECPKCTRSGKAVWEEAAAPGPNGPHPLLLSLPDGFVQRMRRNLATLPEIICDGCGAVVPD